MAHQITGFYFFTKAGGKKYVVYSTLYKEGRFASMHECTSMTDEQAKNAFVLEHSREVDHLLRAKREKENKSKIIV